MTGKLQPLNRLTATWIVHIDRKEAELELAYRLTAYRMFSLAECELRLSKGIYVVFPSAWLEIMGCDMSSSPEILEFIAGIPFAVKIGYATGADDKTMKRRLFDRYKTTMDRPHFVIVYIDGCLTFEVRQIETNLKSKCLHFFSCFVY